MTIWGTILILSSMILLIAAIGILGVFLYQKHRQGIDRSKQKFILIPICCIALAAMSLAGGIFSIKSSLKRESLSSYSAAMFVESDYGGKWDLSFEKLEGHVNNTLNKNSQTPQTMKINSSLSSGNLTLVLSQNSTSVEINLGRGMKNDTADLSKFENGTIILKLIAKDASGRVNISPVN